VFAAREWSIKRSTVNNLLEGVFSDGDNQLTGNKGTVVGCCGFSQSSKDRLDLVEEQFSLITFNNCQCALQNIVFKRNR
jgi:hypothetical protein